MMDHDCDDVLDDGSARVAFQGPDGSVHAVDLVLCDQGETPSERRGWQVLEIGTHRIAVRLFVGGDPGDWRGRDIECSEFGSELS